MKTPEELKKMAQKVLDELNKERKDFQRNERDKEREKKKLMIELAKKDLPKAIEYLENRILNGHGGKQYMIKNSSETYFYDSEQELYWKTLSKEFVGAGFNAKLFYYTNEIYDSMSTTTTYFIEITL